MALAKPLPIWLDHPVEITTSEDFVDYEIRLAGGGSIFAGRAFKLPGAASVRIIPNTVCAPYVAVTGAPPQAAGIITDSSMVQSFELYAGTTLAAAFTFAADYSYRPDGVLVIANAPITGRIARGTLLTVSFYNDYRNNGQSMSYKIFYYDAAGKPIRDYAFDIVTPSYVLTRPYPDNAVRAIYSVGDERVEYRIVDACARYTLYYVNAYGAWDSLLVEGAGKETDEYTRTTYGRAYETTAAALQPRGTVVLQNDYVKKYSLVTGWLTDEQAGRMHHLLGSTNVYLFDAMTGSYLPVVLENSSCEYKTYRNQGGHLVNFTIEATAAQDYTRR